MTRKPADQFGTTTVRPPDFEDFWAAIMAEANAIPLNPSMEHVAMRSTPEVDVYEIGYDSLDGLRIAGWYCRPTDSYVPPPYPALLIVPGYVSEPTLPKSWAKMGYAAVGVAPRGKLRSNRHYNPGYPGLLVNNIVDRHTYSYRGFYVDACRAVDFVLTRPEVDPTRVGVHGSSQGGALTIITAALRRDVIACGAAGAPYLCGFMDAASLTHSWPYQEINDYLRLYPERESDVRATLDYFDGINFAPWITAPMMVYIGLNDDVCPPETGYAVYNAIGGPKELHAQPRAAHDAGRYWVMPKVEAFLAEHLKPVAPVGPRSGNTGIRASTDETERACPVDFAAYWDAVDRELAQYPAASTLERLALPSDEFSNVYAVRLTSTGPYRLFGYLSVPCGDGPFPGLLLAPHYGSVNHLPHLDDRQRYVTLVLMHRGQRLADQPFAATYPGLLTHGIDDPATFVYRGIVADCLRGAEFLQSLPSVDSSRVAISGDDLALITAARRPGFAAVETAGLQFYRLMEAREHTDAYPVEEINEYLRTHPERREPVARTLAYFDPRHHAARITATTLFSVSGGLGGREWLEPLVRAFTAPVEQYALSHEGGTDHDWLDAWMARRLGSEPKPRLWQVVNG